MAEKIYQRPPKKEEINEFLKKIKYALFFSLIALTTLALFIGVFYLLQFKSTQDLVEHAIQNLSVLATLVLLILLTKELISILVLDTANKSDAISKSGAFALLATFLDQDPEGSEQLFVEVKGQQYTGPDLLFDFLKSIDVDKLDENRFKANKERAFKLLRNADKKRELGTPLPSPQPLEPYYNYFE